LDDYQPMPTIPRLPFVGDPLRRIRLPGDLDEVTTVGDERDPAEAGIDADSVEAVSTPRSRSA
jgi:hypothetical protein